LRGDELRKARFGVIGVGFWGRNHARVISELKNAVLVAVCDRDSARAKIVGEKFGVDWFTDDQELLRRNDVDAVTICTPTTTHDEVALKAIDAKKHVMVEKPIADTVEEAKGILKAAETRGVHVMTGFIERFNPGIQKMKALIEEGSLGEIVLAFARRVGRWPERVGDVGVVKDAAIHDIDIMRFMFNSEPTSVYARVGRLVHRFEDYAQIILGFKDNQTAFVEANWLTPRKIRELTVTGSDAMATVDYITQKILVEDADKQVSPTYSWKEPLSLELEHFAECVVGDMKPQVTGLDGLRALEIAEAALKSARIGESVKLKRSTYI
jgi:UDP-N-acetylglucosamine 3-dehydrogenase